MTEEELTEFLVQSNYIENERSPLAHLDARVAWDYLVQADELTEFTLKETHKFLLRNLAPDWAGKHWPSHKGWSRGTERRIKWEFE